jgi:hypothetical protein
MNRIIRQISVIGLFMLAVTIGVSAQSNQQYRADVPFGFDVNGKHYAAGEYSVGPVSQVASPGGIAIKDLQNGNAQLLGINSQQGDRNWDKPGQLSFLKMNGRYILTDISTATFKMKMKTSKARDGELAEVVAVRLK